MQNQQPAPKLALPAGPGHFEVEEAKPPPIVSPQHQHADHTPTENGRYEGQTRARELRRPNVTAAKADHGNINGQDKTAESGDQQAFSVGGHR